MMSRFKIAKIVVGNEKKSILKCLLIISAKKKS